VYKGNKEIVLFLIENGADVNAEGRSRDLPIEAAYTRRDHEMAQLLAEKGTDPNHKGKSDWTTLGYAIFRRLPKTAEILVEKGGDPTLGEINRKSPIKMAVSKGYREVVDLMLKKRPELAASESVLRELMQEAAASGQMEMVSYLIGKGGNIKWVMNSSAMREAARNGHIQTFDLLDSRSIELKGDFLNAALTGAAEGHQEELVRRFLKKGAHPEGDYEYRGGLVMRVTERGTPEILQLLLENGASPNVRRRDSRRMAENQPLKVALEKNLARKVRLLVQHDASLNIWANNARPLECAIRQGMIEEARLMVEKGADIDAQHCAALSAAIRTKEAEFVRYLLDKGASLVDKERNPRTPAFVADAIKHGNREIAVMLIKAGADVNTPGISSPLCSAAELGDKELVGILIEAGADPAIVVKNRLSPLAGAVAGGNREIVEMFLDLGADVNGAPGDSDDTGKRTTPLIVAAWHKNTELAELLIMKGADVNYGSGWNALFAALAADDTKMIELLVKHGANLEAKGNEDMTPLILAASKGNFAASELLLKLGSDPNAKDRWGGTALHRACSHRASAELIELLLKNGAKVDAVTDYGYTPLMNCCSSGDIRIARLLISSGADVNHSTDGASPLSMALRSNREDIAKMLEEQGAKLTDQGALFIISHRNGAIPKASDIELLSRFDRVDFSTPSGNAVWRRAVMSLVVEYAKLLMKKGADPSSVDPRKRPMIFLALDEEFASREVAKLFPGADYSTPGDLTPMETWEYHKRFQDKMIITLLEAGADPDAKGPRNETLLHIGAQTGRTDLMKALFRADADVNADDGFGSTPLHWAVKAKKVEAVELLLQNGADPALKDKQGKKPIDYARDEKITEMLKQAGK
jgi:ankyrin repeat protein